MVEVYIEHQGDAGDVPSSEIGKQSPLVCIPVIGEEMPPKKDTTISTPRGWVKRLAMKRIGGSRFKLDEKLKGVEATTSKPIVASESSSEIGRAHV